MNKTIALAAIVMVAVVMGMSAFVPAAMARGPPANDDFQVCHRGGVVDSPPDGTEWVVMNLPNKSSQDKHIDHGDYGISNGDTDVETCELDEDDENVLPYPQPEDP